MTLQMPRGPDDPPTVRLGRLYVRSSHHGRGLGRRLMDEAVSLGKLAELRTLELTVWENNTAAIAFYEYVGFSACGEIPFVMGDDVQRDIVMRLPL